MRKAAGHVHSVGRQVLALADVVSAVAVEQVQPVSMLNVDDAAMSWYTFVVLVLVSAWYCGADLTC